MACQQSCQLESRWPPSPFCSQMQTQFFHCPGEYWTTSHRAQPSVGNRWINRGEIATKGRIRGRKLRAVHITLEAGVKATRGLCITTARAQVLVLWNIHLEMHHRKTISLLGYLDEIIVRMFSVHAEETPHKRKRHRSWRKIWRILIPEIVSYEEQNGDKKKQSPDVKI